MKKKINQFSYFKLSISIIFFVVILLFIFFIYLYLSIEKDKTVGYDETETYIYDKTEIVTIDAITSFQSEDLFHIVTGLDANQEKFIVFLPLDEKANFTVIPFNETISEEEIIEKWQVSCEKCQSLMTNYAMIEEEPLWELTYIDESNRYVFDYFSLNDGDQFEQLRLYRKYR